GAELFVELLQGALPASTVAGQGDVVGALGESGRLEGVGFVDQHQMAEVKNRLLDHHGVSDPRVDQDRNLDTADHQVDVTGHYDVGVSQGGLLPVFAAVAVPGAAVPPRRAGLRIGSLDAGAWLLPGLPQVDLL